MTIEQLFGTLQQSIVDIWREHLKTDSYSSHMAMDEYYKDMPELIDQLIENYMGRYGKVLSYESILNPGSFTNPVEYLTTLRTMVGETYGTITPSELKSDLDAILSQIDSTIYKLRELTESEEVEFTLDEGAGCAGCNKGTKKDREEECEIAGKKKKGTKKDGEEECEVNEWVISFGSTGSKKGKKGARKAKKPLRESLTEYLSRTL